MSGLSEPQRRGNQAPSTSRLEEGAAPGSSSVRGARARAIAGVAGERGIAAVARALSLQARVSHWLATAVMLLVGCGLLAWYYTHQVEGAGRRRAPAAPAQQSIAAEMALPPLGPIEPPAGAPLGESTAGRMSPPAVVRTREGVPDGASASRPALDATAAPVLMDAPPGGTGLEPALPAATVPRAARAAASRDRRFSAEVYVAAASPSSGSPPAAAPQGLVQDAAAAGAGAAAPTAPTAPAAIDRAGLSAPLAVPVTAKSLGRQSLILPKGTSIDCTLETAIDSTLPGLTRCLTATDTFGADGRVVLLERGTELVGETQGQVQQGAARIFVMWNEARTPEGIIVPLESPGADELGRAGLPGSVQRHFWERFGAAILVSTIDGAVEAAVQSSSRSNGTVIYNPGASQDVMTEVLRSTVAIAPTVRKANGDRIQVLVARDVDFGDVYELRAAASR